MNHIAFKLAAILLVLFLASQVVSELRKPDLADVQQELTLQLRQTGEIDDVTEVTQSDVDARKLAYQSGSRLFLMILLTACGAGFVAIKIVIPMFNDGVNDLFRDTSGLSGYVRAKMLENKGKYEAAIEAFRAYQKENPADKRAVIDIARIQESKLGKSDAAIGTYLTEIDRTDLAEEIRAEYAMHLAELYLEKRRDADEGKRWLEEITRKFANTPQAGMAYTKLQTIREAEFLARQRNQS